MNPLKKLLIKYMPNSIWYILLPPYYKVEMRILNFIYKLKGEEVDPYKIPIIINNFNRLSYLIKLTSSLEKKGYHNIFIIDNKSTYPPLLDYYKNCKYSVIKLDNNVGFRSIWDTNIYKRFWHSYYVYTDVDMEICEECPSNFMEFFISLLEKYPMCQKVGFGLKIDDLPDCYMMKDEVIRHEQQYWEDEIEPGLYNACIDTTFALYRPFTGSSANAQRLNLRTGGDYLIRHLPWYQDTQNPTDEDKYYTNSISQSTHWSVKNKK